MILASQTAEVLKSRGITEYKIELLCEHQSEKEQDFLYSTLQHIISVWVGKESKTTLKGSETSIFAEGAHLQGTSLKISKLDKKEETNSQQPGHESSKPFTVQISEEEKKTEK